MGITNPTANDWPKAPNKRPNTDGLIICWANARISPDPPILQKLALNDFVFWLQFHETHLPLKLGKMNYVYPTKSFG